MTETISIVNHWIDTARALLAKEPQIPLINDLRIEMGLGGAWWDGDDDLRTAIENALARDPDDLPSRFVALNAYYLLANCIPSESSFGLDDRQEVHMLPALEPQELREYLGYLVRLRDVENCADIPTIRWETVNACAVNDYERALRLVGQLGALLPASTAHYHLGRLHFQIAVRNTWEEEAALEHWDLPLGKRPGGPRGFWQYLNAGRIHTAGIQLLPTRARLTEDGTDHLRDAIKHLEKIIDTSEVPPSARFMLALSYSCIGDGHNAARHYQWMVDNQQRFLAACAQEEGPLWDDAETDDVTNLDVFTNGIHSCLVNAYDDANELDNAINAANAWIIACPDHLGTYERMARLYQKRNDYQAVAEWLWKERDRNPSFGEDPNISTILALGSYGTTARMDEALTKIANAHPNELAITEFVVNSYWPPFASLATESKQKWALGTWLLSLNLRAGTGEAAHCFAWVVERELRTTIFAPFKDDIKGRPELFTLDDEDSSPFVGYLTGCPKFTLGEMLRTLDSAREPRTGLHSAFAEWLNGKNPMLLPRFATVRADTIRTFRNREDHADLLSITASDAEIMNRRCRHLINLLHPR